MKQQSGRENSRRKSGAGSIAVLLNLYYEINDICSLYVSFKIAVNDKKSLNKNR